MIVDNLIVNAFSKELIKYIKGGKVERVAQISKDCFLFNIWNKKLFKIVVSLNPETYRMSFTDKNYKVNNQGSTFFVHLKKAIESGTILDIEQINFDRIINFKIESFDNVRDKVTFNLIIELTGKYSNMILLDQNNIVLGTHKIVDESQSEERQILLSERYAPITNKDNKINLTELDYQTYDDLITNNKLNLKNFLVKKFLGISNHTASILLKRADITNVSTFKNNLFNTLKDFSKKQEENNINLEFFIKKENNRIIDIDFDFSETETTDISKIVDKYYQDRESSNEFNALQNNLKKIVDKALLKARDKKSILEDNINKSEKFESFKELGDLIFSNLHNLPEKATSIEVENYYDNNEKITIELDENKTVSENAQLFFKKYNKLKNGIEKSLELIVDVENEVSYLEEVNLFLENSESIEDLKEIEEELITEKYINKYVKTAIKKHKMDKSHLMSFATESGLEVLVGKNNTQNDFLTTKFASNNDIWLHTRLIPGSHVVIRTENGQKKVSDNDITEAAKLAAKYSKAKFSSNVCVIYTKIKNIKKPPKSKPGLVIYNSEKAVYVTP